MTTGLLTFGIGIAVGAAINNNQCCGWGYSYWNCNWRGGTLVYKQQLTTEYGMARRPLRFQCYRLWSVWGDSGSNCL